MTQFRLLMDAGALRKQASVVFHKKGGKNAVFFVFFYDVSNMLFSFPSNPESDENTDIGIIPMFPVAQGHDDLNSTRYHRVIWDWMSHLEEGRRKTKKCMKVHVDPSQLEKDQIGQIPTHCGWSWSYCSGLDLEQEKNICLIQRCYYLYNRTRLM